MTAEVVVVHDVAGSVFATVDAETKQRAVSAAYRLMFAAHAALGEGVRLVLHAGYGNKNPEALVEFRPLRPVFPRELKGVVESLVARAMGG